MGDSGNDLSGRVGLDVSEFKNGIASMNREIRVIESGFKASAAALGDWSQSAEGLGQRAEALTGVIGVQEKKLAALRAEHARVAKETGENSKAAQDLQVRINGETESLNRNKRELGDVQDKLNGVEKEGDQAGKSLTDMGEKAEKSGGKLAGLKKIAGGLGTGLKVMGTALLGVATAAVAAAAGVGKLVSKSAEIGEELTDMSAKTGIGVERLQEMNYAANILGSDLDTITGSMTKMKRTMGAALKGGEAAESFKNLGVAITDTNGELRDSEDVFGDALKALGKVENATERDILAMAIFGKTAEELNPLIEAGGDEIARLSAEARTMGAVMSKEDVAAAAAFKDQVDGLKMGMEGTAATVGVAFMPALASIATKGGGYLKEFAAIVKGADGDLSKIGPGMAAIFTQIVKDIASETPKMMQAGLGIVQGLISAIVASIPQIMPAVLAIVNSLVDFLVANLPMLLTAGIQIITSLASGIAQALPTLIPAIVSVVLQMVQTLIQNVPMLVQAAVQLITGLATGLVAALPILIEMAPQIVAAVFTAIIASLPMIAEAAVQLIVTLVTGIIGALPKLGEAAGQIVGAVVKGVAGLAGSLLKVGENIVMGVWNGLVAKAAWFKDQITGFFSGIVDGVKDFLGIQSPSKVFGGIGKNMALGLGIGFSRELAGVERGIAKAMGGLTSGVTMPVSLAGAGAGGRSTQANYYYGPVYNISGSGANGKGQKGKRW